MRTWNHNVDIACCTIEKGNSILNKIFLEGKHPSDYFGVVIIDEIHILADKGRGYLIEILASKILLENRYVDTFNSGVSDISEKKRKVQIIGLSATLPNLPLIAQWLHAKCFVTEIRPTPLEFFFKSGLQISKIDLVNRSTHVVRDLSRTLSILEKASQSMAKRTQVDDIGHLGLLVWDCISKKKSVMVYCATRDWTEQSTRTITKVIKVFKQSLHAEVDNEEANILNDLLASLREQARNEETELHPTLEASIPEGIAFHHAGLSSECRNTIEIATRKGHIRCICATSTLAVGVNLPFYRVILRSLMVGRDSMGAARFLQIAGRAGRFGLDKKGEAIVFADKETDVETILSYTCQKPENAKSALTQIRLCRFIVEIGVCFNLKSLTSLLGVIDTTTLLALEGEKDNLVEEVVRCLRYLRAQGFVHLSFPGDSSEAPAFY
eukprot:GHVP01020809.1.p1 GENE.GHVP01020809.1~~GHVP01020809.1.p1  ORF type:complete len:439 (-),score=68.47 GHVP01020809.1:271-1587(-)